MQRTNRYLENLRSKAIKRLTRRKRRHIPKKRRERIFKRDRGRCRYCDTRLGFDEIHVDHIRPISKFGSDWSSNLVIACPDCNLRKNKRVEGWQILKIPFYQHIGSNIRIILYKDYPRLKDYWW